MNELIKIVIEEMPSAIVVAAIIAALQGLTELYRVFKKEKQTEPTFAEKLNASIEQLKSASKNMDNLVNSITDLTHEKHEKLTKLQIELQNLSQKEDETRKKIEVLKQIPIEALKHFEDMMKPGEKRSARRDYLLFAAGAFFSIFSTIILKLLGWA